MSHLPILIPGRAEPVNVPFALEPVFTFNVDVFLPHDGVQSVSVWLSSRDLTNAEIAKVEGRHVDLSEAGQRAADEAAGDVLEAVQRRLGLDFRDTGKPNGARTTAGPMAAIARAYLAEREAFAAAVASHASLPRRLHSPSLVPADPSEAGTWTPSRAILVAYVEWCFEEAQKAQAAKAQQQANEWTRENAGDSQPSGSERGLF